MKTVLLFLSAFFCFYSPVNAQLFNKAAKDIKKAEDFISKKQYEDAIKSLEAALDNSKGKDDYEVYYLKGFCQYQLKKYDQALEQFNFTLAKVNSKQVLPSKPDEFVLNGLLYRARTYEALGDYTSAIKDLQLLTTGKTKPELRSEAYEKWSRNFYEMDRIANQDRAELIIAKAIEVDPKNASALCYQAELAMNERGYEEAVNPIERAIQLETDVFEKARYQSLLALCKYRLGKKEEALKIFKEAVETAPESTKWKIYQQHANLVILHHLYDPSMLSQAKLWSNRAAILSEECSNSITFAYMLALNNDLTQAKEVIEATPTCQNPLLRLSKDSLGTWLDDLVKSAKQNIKVKAYGNSSWYYWGSSKAGLAEGRGKAISKNFLYELNNGQFVKGELVAGTLTNVSEGWVYNGTFKGETIAGNGTITYPDGEKYTGKFLNNLPNGKGKWTYSNGSTYEGDVVNNVPEGNGKFLGEDGTAYEGQFKKGKPHGRGYLTVNGNREMAEFTEGARTDAVFLARQKEAQQKAEENKREQQSLAMQRIKQEELAKAEKRKKTGKFIGKTLALAGGAYALKQASDLGMSDLDVTELGTALVTDLLTDGKENALMNTLAAKGASNLQNPITNPATPGQPSGASGAAGAKCDCKNDPKSMGYLNKAKGGGDAQVMALYGQRACYEYILKTCPNGAQQQLAKQIADVTRVINQMENTK
ncbi:MAG: hypothetical protein JWP69_944 [Flaviaesturariibacter sp.]|nr:hypothetical protein [Flaviaesturariibacter sp.]